MRGLAGKVILITGGSSGIGEETARRLASEGAIVAIGDIDLDRAEGVAEAIRTAGGAARAHSLDVSNEARFRDVIAGVVRDHGGLDGLFNNAADTGIYAQDTDIVANDIANWQRSLDVDLTGGYYGARHAIPELLKRGGGTILFNSSDAAFMGLKEAPAYSVAKAGMLALVRHIAANWGRQGIRANAVSPGAIVTAAHEAVVTAETLQGYLEESRSSRLGRPEDVAALVAFLFSDDAEWITGQTYHVNGGLILR